eukprot:GHRR01006110.1.p1 GENE.GHRR01006110.1~~GHRR01006110.1.p1  ORF type:complete len:432 (+),score=93.29 GHRR01006110.1:312-1607(+)
MDQTKHIGNVNQHGSNSSRLSSPLPAGGLPTESSYFDFLTDLQQDTRLHDMELGALTKQPAPIAAQLSPSLSTASSTPSSPQAVVSVLVASNQSQRVAGAVCINLTQPAEASQPQQAPIRTHSWKLVNYLLIPCLLPIIGLYLLLALLLAVAVTFTITPSYLLARQLYWACPFIPYIWKSDNIRDRVGVVGSWLLRVQFEGAHCITVLARLFSLPLRPHLPDFYILGFPKCGTTSMASYLTTHPAISGLAGMPGNEVFSKESHFFNGILGRSSTNSRLLYKSFFPTIISRWWAEAVLGVERWMCFDACPTYACLPHVAARVKEVSPHAKLIVMVRDPVASVFSAETMLRNMGVPLTWSLQQPLAGDGAADPRFQFSAEDAAFWHDLECLPPEAPLPADLPVRFYTHLHSYVMAARFADRLRPWVEAFGQHK